MVNDLIKDRADLWKDVLDFYFFVDSLRRVLSIVITRRYFFLDPERIVEISFSLPLAPLCHFQFVIRWITFIFDSIERIGRENRENCYSSKISYDRNPSIKI